MEDDSGHEALVLEAGRAIRPYLSALIGEDANRVDAALSDIFDEEDCLRSEQAVLDLLDVVPATHDWVSAFWRAGGIPPEVVRSVRPELDAIAAEQQVRAAILGGGASAGDPVLMVPGRRYSCQFGDYVWYREDAAEAIPDCPNHKVRLEPATLAIGRR